MKLIPIAVISGASRGALRSAPVRDALDRHVEGRAEGHRAEQHEQQRARRHEPVLRAVEPEQLIPSVTLIMVPHMKTSPCAKLISSMMP